MKKTNIIFWVITGLFAAFMLFSSIPDILLTPEAKAFMGHLGYPDYFTVFIGVMKVLGIIAILVPGFPRVKEWAYAGLSFDLIGATYSVIAREGFQLPVVIMLLPLVLCGISYSYFHKRLKKSPIPAF
ncbi:MAG: DoxX family protein [Bacteroidetes bacterium]|nr:DoxX family protein [Bacteroidota bacterium]